VAARAGGPCESGGVEVEYVDPDRGVGTEAAGGLLVFAVRADERGAGLCVIPGSAELAGLVVVSRTGGHVAMSRGWNATC
jgi:hypothetical protein